MGPFSLDERVYIVYHKKFRTKSSKRVKTAQPESSTPILEMFSFLKSGSYIRQLDPPEGFIAFPCMSI